MKEVGGSTFTPGQPGRGQQGACHSARLRRDATDAQARKPIAELYALARRDIADHFHPPTRQWAGKMQVYALPGYSKDNNCLVLYLFLAKTWDS